MLLKTRSAYRVGPLVIKGIEEFWKSWSRGVYLKNSEKYKTKDDVYDLFFKAHFSGDLSEVARELKLLFGNKIIGMLKNMKFDEGGEIEFIKEMKA